MAGDRVTETPHTTVIERRGGGGGLLIGLALLIAVGAFYLFNKSQNDNMRTDAVTSAADKIGGAADKAGDAAKSAADKAQ